MASPQFSEETLMAYIDGALDDESALAVEAAAADDEAVAARVETLRRTREISRAALMPLLREPVPEALATHVRAFAARHPHAPLQAADSSETEEAAENSNVVPLQRRGRLPIFTTRFLGTGLAASLALIVGLAGGYFAAIDQRPTGERLQTVSFAQAGLVDALYDVPSGGERHLPEGDRFRAIATFGLGGETLCREFEVDSPTGESVVAVACRDDGAWRTRFVVASQASGQGYAPAASLDVLQTYLSAVGADAPLGVDEEAAALSALR